MSRQCDFYGFLCANLSFKVFYALPTATTSDVIRCNCSCSSIEAIELARMDSKRTMSMPRKANKFQAPPTRLVQRLAFSAHQPPLAPPAAFLCCSAFAAIVTNVAWFILLFVGALMLFIFSILFLSCVFLFVWFLYFFFFFVFAYLLRKIFQSIGCNASMVCRCNIVRCI